MEDVALCGASVAEAEQAARALARLEDPELEVPGASLPGLVRLGPLLGLEEVTASQVRRLWGSPGVSTPIGVGERGVMELDVVRDGPHGLVGGTTGSGKSEFLRSLVAGLAARNDPTRLTFILIDFKGGAAFKTCERLPHTIGTISNLDAQMADRALRALEAEMTYRQRLFASAGDGVDNLDAYLATSPSEPVPRLLLVVDEFAMLAKEYPDVLSSLVSVAAVGRTLGVHMVLATQRPAGVVNDDILANTNLRVALRVQSREDSSNVIDVPDAAAIGRQQKGRALVKLGQDDITPVQTPLVTGPIESEEREAIAFTDLTTGGSPAPSRPAPPGHHQGGSHLQGAADDGVGGVGEDPGGPVGVHPVQGVGQGGAQELTGPDPHHRLHRLYRPTLQLLSPAPGPTTQVTAPHDPGDLLGEGLPAAGTQLGVVVQPGRGLRVLGQADGGPARPGQDVAQPLGGVGGVAQHPQVPVGAADHLGELAEGQQPGVGVGAVGEPADHDRQELTLDGGTTGDPLGEGLDMTQGTIRVQVPEGRQALTGGVRAQGHLVGGQARGRPQQRTVVDLLVEAADLPLEIPEDGDQSGGVGQAVPVDPPPDPPEVLRTLRQVVGAAQAGQLGPVLQQAQGPVAVGQGRGVSP